MTDIKKPKVNSASERELDKVQEQFEQFDGQVKTLTLDRMNEAPILEKEQQTKIAGRDIDKSKDIYLKPKRSLSPGINPKTGEREKFNEKFREDYNFQKEYVNFIAENKEIIGETISMWTKPFPGMNCEEWDIPTNKPVWAPRYVAERIVGCKYHRLRMENRPTNLAGEGTYYGDIVVDNTVQRLDAYPVTKKRSLFMGANAF